MRHLPLPSFAALILAVCAVVFPGAAFAALDAKQSEALIRRVDAIQVRGGDWKGLAVLVHQEKGKPAVAQEAVVYNRDDGMKMVLVFLKPKTQAGRGYLLLDRNIWYYDPGVGKWERRTENDRIGGTTARRADFDAPRYGDRYTATFEADEKIGDVLVHRLALKAKPGVDVAYPIVKLWVDPKTAQVIKSEEYADSGRKLRSSFFNKWQKIDSESKGQPVWFPREIRLFSELERAQTVVHIKAVDARRLPANVFTKAWLESKSR